MFSSRSILFLFSLLLLSALNDLTGPSAGPLAQTTSSIPFLGWQEACWRASSLDGATAGRYTSKHFLPNQQKNSYLPLVYHESLLWSVLFCFEVFMIENDYTWKGKLVFFFFFFFIHQV